MELNGQQHRNRIFGAQGGRARHVAAFAVAAAVLGATAACTGSSGSPTSGGTSTAGTTLSPTATSSTTQAGGASTATGTSAAGAGNPTSASSAANGSNSNASSRAVSGGTSSCTGSEIKVTLGQSDAGMSHDAVPLVFTNTSSQTCTMQGYPGAAVMNGSTVVLNSTRSLNGYIGDERQLSSAPLITLAPGARASAMLEYVADAGETCYPNGSGTLEATPPNTTTTTSLMSMTTGTAGVCADFEIHPVVAGTFSG